MGNQKTEIVSFKADDSLVEALRRIPNRSAFIRSALLAALDNVCPVCQGQGLLTPAQKRHWHEFSQDHIVEECDECHEVHIVCAHQDDSE